MSVLTKDPEVLGLDLSLTSTGMAGKGWTRAVRPTLGITGCDRLKWIRGEVQTAVIAADLIVIEGPAYGVRGGQSGHHERAGLWWVIRCMIEEWCKPVAVVPPSVLKKYATGRGTADKSDVVREVTRRFPAFEGGNDEADALVMSAMGADWLGHPYVQMPASHRVALQSCSWPIPQGAVSR